MNEKLAWLSGIIDGEGCIYSQIRNTSISVFLRVNTISVLMAAKLNEIYSELDIKFSQKLRTNDKRKGRRPVIDTCVTNKEGVEKILTACLPYLTTKKEEAILMLSFIENKISREDLHNGLRQLKREVQFARLR